MTCFKCGNETCTCEESPKLVYSTELPKIDDGVTTREEFNGIIYLLGGALLYPIVNWIFITRYICLMISTFIHELGHFLVNLFWGEISVPLVNVFLIPNGNGGITVSILSLGLFGSFLFFGTLFALGKYYEDYLKRVQPFLQYGIIFLFCLTFMFDGLKETLILSGGHFFTSVGSGIMLYLCAFHKNTKSINRPIYSVIGWWSLFYQFEFYHTLISDTRAQENYFNSGITNDLVRIYVGHSGISFESIVSIFTYINYIPVLVIIILFVIKMRKVFFVKTN